MYDFSNNPNLSRDQALARHNEMIANAARERLARSAQGAQPAKQNSPVLRLGWAVTVPAVAIFALNLLLNL
jgi:hypothetical protein